MEVKCVFFLVFHGLGCVTCCDSNEFHNSDSVRHLAVLLGWGVGLCRGLCSIPVEHRYSAARLQYCQDLSSASAP